MTYEKINKSLDNIEKKMNEKQMRINELEKDKDTMLKIIAGTDDAIALINVKHKAAFIITQVLKEIISDGSKLSRLMTYLKPLIEENKNDVLDSINMLKTDIENKDVLNDLTSWINEHY